MGNLHHYAESIIESDSYVFFLIKLDMHEWEGESLYQKRLCYDFSVYNFSDSLYRIYQR